jgi:hypothetical protein
VEEKLSKPDQAVAGSTKFFRVNRVEPASGLIWTETLAEHVGKRFKREVLLLPQSEKLVINAVADQMHRDPRLSHRASASIRRVHPLIDAVDTAFSWHWPLKISPDAIWMTIEQGFAHHVNENAESLRPRLVRHEGKVPLVVDACGTNETAIQQAIAGFGNLIREHTDPVMYDTLVCDFSTTSAAIRTASEVVLMDCYASYFHYEMRYVCGIPRVAVTGSVEDWERMRARIEVLATFGLEWWTKRLRPILDEFVETAKGRRNLRFWQAIYKPKDAYGDGSVTGWIADLFPYLGDAPRRMKNYVLESERRDWAVPVERGFRTGIGRGSFPCGLASVPVTLANWPDGREEADFVAGFVGVEQDVSDFSLSPVIGWCVAEKAPKEPVVI